MQRFHIFLFLGISSFFFACSGKTAALPSNDEKQNSHFSDADTVFELSKNIMTVYQDSKNNYWFGSWEDGVYKYDGKTLLHYTKKQGLADNRIDEIKEDDIGNLYFASCNIKNEITQFDGKKFKQLQAKNSLEWQIKPNDLWFRHSFENEAKVYRFDGENLFILQVPSPPALPQPFGVYSIYEDSKGNIWFGTNPVGVCRFDGSSFEWICEEDITEFRNEGANGVRSILEDSKGDFWFNTEFSYGIYDETTRNGNRFYTRNKSIGSLDGKENSKLNEYLSSLKDRENNLWFVTYRDGVWKYDGQKVTHYPINVDSKAITTFSIYEDRSGQLWIGTHENGVLRFNGSTFEKFNP